MKTIGITAGIDDLRFKRWAPMAAERFKRVNGFDVMVVFEPPKGVALRKPTWVKAWVWDLVPEDVERVIWIDADMIALEAFTEADMRRTELHPFCACPDVPGLLDGERHELPVLWRQKNYFNAGLFIAQRGSQCVFEKLKEYMTDPPGGTMGRYEEQNWLNYLVQEFLGGFHEMPCEWNWFAFHPKYGMPPPPGVKMLHFAGWSNGGRALDEAWEQYADQA